VHIFVNLPCKRIYQRLGFDQTPEISENKRYQEIEKREDQRQHKYLIKVTEEGNSKLDETLRLWKEYHVNHIYQKEKNDDDK